MVLVCFRLEICVTLTCASLTAAVSVTFVVAVVLVLGVEGFSPDSAFGVGPLLGSIVGSLTDVKVVDSDGDGDSDSAAVTERVLYSTSSNDGCGCPIEDLICLLCMIYDYEEAASVDSDGDGLTDTSTALEDDCVKESHSNDG